MCLLYLKFSDLLPETHLFFSFGLNNIDYFFSYSLLDKSPDGTIFIVMCFLCRSIEALGASAFVTALFAILAHEFPDNVITVMVGFLYIFPAIYDNCHLPSHVLINFICKQYGPRSDCCFGAV